MSVGSEVERQKYLETKIWKEHFFEENKIDPIEKKNPKKNEKSVFAITSAEWKKRNIAKLQ